MLQSLFLLCTVLALSSALPHRHWHFTHRTEDAVKTQEHKWEADIDHAAMDAFQAVGETICRSAVGKLDRGNGVTVQRSYHICRQEGSDPEFGGTKEEECFYTSASCCLAVPGLRHSTHEISAGLSPPVTVEFFSIGNKIDLCYKLSRNITSCLPREQCVPGCVGPDPVCIKNTLTGTDDSCTSLTCECKPGYDPPSCCNCTRGFVEIDGVCKEPCVKGCERRDEVRGCSRCREGYGPLPLCCNCTGLFFRNENDDCEEPECVGNVDSCDNGECICKEGFGPAPHCCFCIDNVVPGSCDTPAGCQCKDGFEGDDCCTVEPRCRENVDTCDRDGCTCLEGFGPEPDCCYCQDNIVPGSCVNGVCQCKIGFEGDDCCKVEPRCRQNVASCDAKTCVCNTGFGPPPDCCYCDSNIDLTTCDENGCQCKDGFEGEDCCTVKPRCRQNTESCNTETCVCKTGFGPPPNCCFCDSNIDLSTCDENGAGCQCKDGFEGEDCCTVKPRCRQNTESCNTETCVCKTGFGPPPNCCFCDSNIDLTTCDENGAGCQCKDGFEGEDCCTVKPRCRQNTESCNTETCVCKTGFGPPPNCCFCDSNIDLSTCDENGAGCQCKDGFEGEDCCTVTPKCRQNVVSCDSKSCTCKDKFGPPPDCCFCEDNIDPDSCKDGVCQCKSGFRGDDCCTVIPPCTGIQDIYFLVDGTRSNRRPLFCQEIYAIELISAALSPRVGNDLSGTRIGAYLYPKSRSSSTESLKYFPVGKYDCSNTVNQFHRLMLAFTHDLFDLEETDTELYNLQRNSLRGSDTLPLKSIQLLTDTIKDDVQRDGNRKRVVIILTDGPPDGDSDAVITKAIEDLVEAGGNTLTLIAGGIASLLEDNDLNSYRLFADHVKLLANNVNDNSYVTPRGSNTDDAGILLGRELVNIMESNGAICDKQADAIQQLLADSDRLYYCDCNVFRPRSDDPCSNSCPSNIFKNGAGREDCKIPPTEQCTILSDLARFSSLVAPAPSNVKAESEDPGLVSLEEQIIAAVENVLVEEGIIEVDRD